MSSSSSSIQHATYPLPQPLALLLEAAAQKNHAASVSKESTSAALAQLIGNAFSAVDRLYFETPSRIRSAEWFSHRTCLRIHVTPGTLSITDLGAGMTRADLINSLGIGRMSKRAMRVVMTKLTKNDTQDDDEEEKEADTDGVDEQSALEEQPVGQDTGEKAEDDTVDTDDDEDEDDDEDDDDDGDDDVENEVVSEKANGDTETDHDYSVLPCLEADIGGFYSALCALGHGVTIGTKVCVCCHEYLCVERYLV